MPQPSAGRVDRHRGPALLRAPRRRPARPDALGRQHQRRRHAGRLDADHAVRQAGPLLPGRRRPAEAGGGHRANLHRKIEDAKCAIYLEETLKESKQKILQNYLNIAFFGENSYGIQTAAETYFNKPAPKLTLPSRRCWSDCCARRRPTTRSSTRPPRRSAATRCCRTSSPSASSARSQADKVKAKPISLATAVAAAGPPRVRELEQFESRTSAFFCEYVVDWLQTVGGLSLNDLQTGGYRIVTTLDPKLQTSTQRNIRRQSRPKSPMTAVLPVLDPRTGESSPWRRASATAPSPGETEQPVFTTLRRGRRLDLQALPAARRALHRRARRLAARDGRQRRHLVQPTNCATARPGGQRRRERRSTTRTRRWPRRR